jgi:16S rRNA (uracil1498-N3)-methyltransferase
MKRRGSAHEFALYVSDIPSVELKVGAGIEFHEPEFVHRVSRVLRLDVDDNIILFNAEYHLSVVIKKISKNVILVELESIGHNKFFKPYITLLLPLLKREALEQAIYSAVELGVNKIQLLVTQKVQRNWQAKELERLKHIMIAAAEQSKCFAIPEIVEPVPLLDVPLSDYTVFFDPEGEALVDVLTKDFHKKQIESLTVVVGPEGDLTESEKFYLQKQQALFVRLTPTILRAQQAVALGVGILRSFFSIY